MFLSTQVWTLGDGMKFEHALQPMSDFLLLLLLLLCLVSDPAAITSTHYDPLNRPFSLAVDLRHEQRCNPAIASIGASCLTWRWLYVTIRVHCWPDHLIVSLRLSSH